jgi:hypothetical protein
MRMSLAGETLFISGGSRGIGLVIASRAARDGANVVLAAKTTEPRAKLEAAIYTASAEMPFPSINLGLNRQAASALPLPGAVRHPRAVEFLLPGKPIDAETALLMEPGPALASSTRKCCASATLNSGMSSPAWLRSGLK